MTILIARVLLACRVLLLPVQISAREAVTARQYAVSSWGSESGLDVETQINRIVRANDFVWAATPVGLARFDGIRFHVFNRATWPHLQSHRIIGLAPALGSGDVYIATERGEVGLVRGDSLRILGREQSARITNVHPLGDSVLVGTRRGLRRVSDAGLLGITGALEDAEIYSMCTSGDGSVWVVSAKGVFRFRGSSYEEVAELKSIANVRAVSLRKWPVIWAGTADRGVFEVRAGKVRNFNSAAGLLYDAVIALQQDTEGVVWVGTERGVSRIDGSYAVSGFTRQEGLQSEGVFSLLADEENNIWIGTTAGLHRLRAEPIKSFGAADGLQDQAWSVLESRASGLWVGTANGLYHHNSGRWERLGREQGLPSDTVFSLAEDAEQHLWVGTNKGLCRMSGDSCRLVPFAADAAGSQVYALTRDRQGKIWAGTPKGVRLFESGESRALTSGPLDQQPVSCLYADADGSVWVGTRGRGLFRFAGNVQLDVTDLLPPESRFLHALSRDAKGRLFAGARYEGLLVLTGSDRNRRFVPVPIAGGLRYGSVSAMESDAAGHLWLATSAGLLGIRKEHLDQFADGQIANVPAVRFGTADGLRSIHFSGVQPAVWRAGDGRLWLATAKGLSVAATDELWRLRPDRPRPVTALRAEAAWIFPKEPRAWLPAGTERLEVQLSSPSLGTGHRQEFRYRVDNGAWHPAPNATAILPGTQPGRHLLEVQSHYGGYQSEPVGFAIEQAPLLQQTLWFRFALVAGAFLIMGAFHKWRTGKVLAQERATQLARYQERISIARNLHDSLAQQFYGLSLQLEVLATRKHPPSEAKRILGQAMELARQGLRDSRQAVASLRKSPEGAIDLTLAVRQQIEQIKKEFECAVELRVEGLPFPVRATIAADVVGIARESLCNAVRHARARTIECELQFGGTQLVLAVHDDGIGFVTSEIGIGRYGLIGMRERAELLRGHLSVRSEPGAGTTVMLTVKIPAPETGGGSE